jgi:hypothetical protein
VPVRLFTVEEANRLLAGLDAILERAQAVTAKLRDTRDQLVDLRIVWGERVLDATCPDHAEYETYQAEFTRLEAELETVTAEVTGLGCELKDVENGLVDFQTPRGEEVVYLCWRRGEPRVGWWHSLDSGFAGRQPLDKL